MRLDRATRILEDYGADVRLYATPGPNRAGEMAVRAAKDGCDLVLVAGGDGSINEAVNGIAGTDIAFGVLPAGTANVLANEVGIANRPDRAAAQLRNMVPVRVALGALDRPGEARRYFVMLAGVGLDARIVYELNLDLKNRIGKLSYWHGGFRQFGRPVPRFTVTLNGSEHRASFALITRVRNYGGDFEIARRVRITDDDFEVVIFENSEWPSYLRFFFAVVMNRLDATNGVTIARATSIGLRAAESDRIYIQTDGEAVGVLPASVSIAPDALTLLLPRRYVDSNAARSVSGHVAR